MAGTISSSGSTSSTASAWRHRYLRTHCFLTGGCGTENLWGHTNGHGDFARQTLRTKYVRDCGRTGASRASGPSIARPCTVQLPPPPPTLLLYNQRISSIAVSLVAQAATPAACTSVFFTAALRDSRSRFP